MSLSIQNNYGTINHIENSVVSIHNGQTTVQEKETDVEDITPTESTESVDSIIFTKKAKQEHKESHIIASLQKSVEGRKDKTRAFVHALHEWQNDAYVDAHYNAQVMYDELDKLMPIPFGYEVFKKHYNNTRS